MLYLKKQRDFSFTLKTYVTDTLDLIVRFESNSSLSLLFDIDTQTASDSIRIRGEKRKREKKKIESKEE